MKKIFFICLAMLLVHSLLNAGKTNPNNPPKNTKKEEIKYKTHWVKYILVNGSLEPVTADKNTQNYNTRADKNFKKKPKKYEKKTVPKEKDFCKEFLKFPEDCEENDRKKN